MVAHLIRSVLEFLLLSIFQVSPNFPTLLFLGKTSSVQSGQAANWLINSQFWSENGFLCVEALIV